MQQWCTADEVESAIEESMAEEEEEEAHLWNRHAVDDDEELASSSDSSLHKHSCLKNADRDQDTRARDENLPRKGRKLDGESRRVEEVSRSSGTANGTATPANASHAEHGASSLCFSGSGDYSPRQRLVMHEGAYKLDEETLLSRSQLDSAGRNHRPQGGSDDDDASKDEVLVHGVEDADEETCGTATEVSATELDSLDVEVLSEIERERKDTGDVAHWSWARTCCTLIPRRPGYSCLSECKHDLISYRTPDGRFLAGTGARRSTCVGERPERKAKRKREANAAPGELKVVGQRTMADATGLFPKGVPWGTKIDMLQLAKQDAWHRGATRFSRFMFRWEKEVGLG